VVAVHNESFSMVGQPRSGWVSGSVLASAGVAAYRRSNTGRSERICGRWWKLWWGGGEVVAHSRLLPSQGSSPAGWPRRIEIRKFQRKTRIEMAIR
jgi:hypothetical protein